MEERDTLTGRDGGTTTVTPGGLVKHTVYIPTDTLDRLREKAYFGRTSLSRVIRRAIDEFLEREDAKK